MLSRWTLSSCIKICLVIVIVAVLLSLPRPLLGEMLDLKEGMPWGPKIPNGTATGESSNGTASYYNKPILFCFEDLGHEPKHLFVTVYNSLRIACFYVAPLALNGYMCRAIERALRESSDTMGSLGEQRRHERRKLMRMLRGMVVIFAVCWFPYQFFLAIQAFNDREMFAQKWFQVAMIVVSVFLYFHCISGPVLYYQMNSKFRNGKLTIT